MAANVQPIFSRVGKISWNTTVVMTANTTKDGSTGTIYPLFIADAVNGSRLEKIRIKPLGTNVSTLIRVFINNGGATTDPANNVLYDDIAITSTTNSETSAQNNNEIPLGISLPPGYTVFITLATAVAAGFACTAVGGDY